MKKNLKSKQEQLYSWCEEAMAYFLKRKPCCSKEDSQEITHLHLSPVIQKELEKSRSGSAALRVAQ